jgi:hypothetical protein
MSEEHLIGCPCLSVTFFSLGTRQLPGLPHGTRQTQGVVLQGFSPPLPGAFTPGSAPIVPHLRVRQAEGGRGRGGEEACCGRTWSGIQERGTATSWVCLMPWVALGGVYLFPRPRNVMRQTWTGP